MGKTDDGDEKKISLVQAKDEFAELKDAVDDIAAIADCARISGDELSLRRCMDAITTIYCECIVECAETLQRYLGEDAE